MEKYTIGIDFGTQSGRAVLVRVTDGHIAAHAEQRYAHGHMETQLPDGTPLPCGFVLQDPMDYVDILNALIPTLLTRSGVPAMSVIGIAIDATACSLVPVDECWEPLCHRQEFSSEPHAYLKLWKHSAATAEADHINHVIRQRREPFIEDYGGKCHAEWLFPKLLETLRHAPRVYDSAYRFLEVADWLTIRLCGRERRNSCAASYKAFWRKSAGYPTKDFFAAVDPRLENVVSEKLGKDVHSIGTQAGVLTPAAAKTLGLCPGIAVSVAHTDAHVAPPAVGVTTPGKMLLIIGTSTCNMLLDEEYRFIPGISGVAEDGVVPGLYAYEAGQNAVGDMLNWVATQAVSKEYGRAENIHSALTEKASALLPGESGLLMLDWLGGNRSILSNAELSGLIVGLTLHTLPEEIYRAAIESAAFGQRIILENFREHGVAVDALYACGGIPRKNPLFMQIYADVLNMPIHVSAGDQIPATGAAIFAAVAAGAAAGGYDDIYTAANAMRQPYAKTYTPCPEHTAVYDALYREYQTLYKQFGQASPLMPKLRHFRLQAGERRRRTTC